MATIINCFLRRYLYHKLRADHSKCTRMIFYNNTILGNIFTFSCTNVNFGPIRKRNGNFENTIVWLLSWKHCPSSGCWRRYGKGRFWRANLRKRFVRYSRVFYFHRYTRELRSSFDEKSDGRRLESYIIYQNWWYSCSLWRFFVISGFSVCNV